MIKKSIPLELSEALHQAVEEAAANDAMPARDWVEQLLIKAIAERNQAGYATDRHRAIRVFLRDLDAKKDRSITEMAADAGVSPVIFADIFKQVPGISITDGVGVGYTTAALERLRHALQQPG
jgi:AraC-like DNA-binding protein